MAKIENDKYYTSSELAEYVVNKTKEVIGENNITEYLEPSAGGGAFLDFLDKPYLAYDLYPEDDRIVKQDYLTLDLEYKKGRCIIGNPPYGIKNTLSVQFYKKSITFGEYISFILPISQLNNNQQMYEFDLIYSENLGNRVYSDREVHCCLNIYKKNNKGLNGKPNYRLKDVEIIEVRLKNKIVEDYDLRICAWGNGKKIGKEVEYENQYAKEFCIKIKNKQYKRQILKLFETVNWRNIYLMTNASNLLQWQVYKYIKEQIPEIE